MAKKHIMSTLDEALDRVSVLPLDCGYVPDGHSVKDWFAVSTEDDGIIAYFSKELYACRFRLDLVNRILNP
jgi:hypothetical protein